MVRLIACALCAAVPAPAAAQVGEPLSDAELATITGKFVLPSGVTLALSVTSDTVVDGQLILRTVFRVDDTARVTVMGRMSADSGPAYPGAPTAGDAAAMKPTGVEVAFDRRSGTQTITPTYTAVIPTVSIGGTRPADAAAAGLAALPVSVGGPAVETPDGSVSLSALRNGTQVVLAGQQLSVANLVGSAIATAIANTADNRTIDTVTHVDIDLGDAGALTAGSAALKIDTLVSDVTRGMIR